MVRSPGFGPGFLPWQGNVLDQIVPTATRLLPNCLDYDRTNEQLIIKTLITLKTSGIPPNNRPFAESTIETVDKNLKQLSKNTDLNNPEQVKTYIANAKTKTGQPTANASKDKLVQAYDCLIKAHGLTWTKPHYKPETKTPIIPTKDAVTKITASCTRRYKTIFTLLAETGASPAELHGLTRKDINMEKGEISITGHKGHDSGNYRLKPHIAEMLRDYLTTHTENQPFPNPKSMTHTWIRARDRAADQLKQPEIKNIQLRNLRNYSGATFYNSMPVRDPIAVMRHLRHKKLETTMHYIRAIVLDYGEDDQWTTLITRTNEEECKAIEKGYQLVRAINETTALYKKRK